MMENKYVLGKIDIFNNNNPYDLSNINGKIIQLSICNCESYKKEMVDLQSQIKGLNIRLENRDAQLLEREKKVIELKFYNQQWQDKCDIFTNYINEKINDCTKDDTPCNECDFKDTCETYDLGKKLGCC